MSQPGLARPAPHADPDVQELLVPNQPRWGRRWVLGASGLVQVRPSTSWVWWWGFASNYGIALPGGFQGCAST